MMDNRQFLIDLAMGKSQKEEPYHWVHIIAIEDDQQRFLTKVKVKESILLHEDGFVRVARPDGYVYLWERMHRHDEAIKNPELEQLDQLPRAQRDVEDYRDIIQQHIDIFTLECFNKDWSSEPHNDQLEIERNDSTIAEQKMGVATYEYWRKVHGLNYDENVLANNWKSYCDYREKYGLPKMEIYPE